MDKRIEINQSGFSLLEVMFAIAIFAGFVSVIAQTQSYNVQLSTLMEEELKLHNLAKTKMNEVLIAQKRFTNATEKDPDTGTFKGDENEGYSYRVDFKRTEFPDFAQLMGQDDDQVENQQNQNLQTKIFQKLKLNIEQMIWQVTVTVTNTDTEYSYELNTWMTNQDAKIDLNLSL